MLLHLLIIEDDPLLAEAVSDYFGSKGWQVTIASDGEEALHCFANNNFQLILLDVMLPKRDGFSVCRKINGGHDPHTRKRFFSEAL